MSDLNGEDAFAKVLSELVDASYQMRSSDEARARAESRVRDLENDLATVRRSKTLVEDERARALPFLKELYEAADEVLGTLTGPEKRSRLTAALKAARDHCDQEIPF